MNNGHIDYQGDMANLKRSTDQFMQFHKEKVESASKAVRELKEMTSNTQSTNDLIMKTGTDLWEGAKNRLDEKLAGIKLTRARSTDKFEITLLNTDSKSGLKPPSFKHSDSFSSSTSTKPSPRMKSKNSKRTPSVVKRLSERSCSVGRKSMTQFVSNKPVTRFQSFNSVFSLDS
jgi:hypothetical protein